MHASDARASDALPGRLSAMLCIQNSGAVKRVPEGAPRPVLVLLDKRVAAEDHWREVAGKRCKGEKHKQKLHHQPPPPQQIGFVVMQPERLIADPRLREA